MSLAFALGAIASFVSVVGSAVRWIYEIIQGHAKWIAVHFLFVTAMGGCTGFMGTAIAQVSEFHEWANVLSGALGASGAFGFELVIRRLVGTIKE